MSSLSSSEIQLIEMLTSKTNQLNLYLSLFIFVFGIIGNILNTLVLSRRKLRLNPCIYFFYISSIVNLISILFGLTPRIMSSWNLDLTDTNRYQCKMRAFVTFTSRTIAFWLTTLATIDRWILSQNNPLYRQLSTLKNAQRGTIFVIIFSIFLYLHMIYCYEPNLNLTPLKCYGKTIYCRLLTDITYAYFTILLPFAFMIIFGFLTISNIRRRYNLKLVSTIIFEKNYLIEQKKRWKKIDRYLRRMLFLQIILLIILTLPQTIHKLYSTLTSYKHKSDIQNTMDKIVYKLDLLLPYIASGMPFYVYTLTGGKVFRNAIKTLFVKKINRRRK